MRMRGAREDGEGNEDMYGTRELHHARTLVTPSNNEQAAANHGNGALSAVPVNTMDRTGTPVTAACGSTSR